MMTGLSAFAEKAAAQRAAAFGVSLVFKGKTITGCISSQSTKRQLEEGGFTFDQNTTIRIPITANISPALGDRIKVKNTGAEFIIEEVVTSSLNPEWKLMVKNAAL